MLTNEIQDQIDKYLLSKMTMAEKAIFEKQLLDNSELKEKIEIQRLIINELQYRRDFERIIKQKNSGTLGIVASKIPLRKIMIVAWSAAAIFIGAFFVNQAFVNSRMDDLYMQYYTKPEMAVMRGDNPIEQATILLENNKLQQAKVILEDIYQNSNAEFVEDACWYLALTELKLHNKREAVKYLNELKDSEFYGEKASKLLEEL